MQPDADFVYYDGDCGLCHRTVQFLVARDIGGVFRFAAIDSEAFRTRVAPGLHEELPDSVVVQRPDGSLLVRSDATAYMLRRLGGVWALLGRAIALVPSRLRDAAYDGIARRRLRWFARPAESCPVLPAHLRVRFEE